VFVRTHDVESTGAMVRSKYVFVGTGLSEQADGSNATSAMDVTENDATSDDFDRDFGCKPITSGGAEAAPSPLTLP
jgi:phage FluMu gp28-like protein